MAFFPGELQTPVLSSPIGFEGYEKRLEITFSGAPLFVDPEGRGLRALTRVQIDFILEAARCSIVSQLSNENFDSYVLSESSLFIYPHKLIIKTCGTTKLLSAIPRILDLASALSLSVLSAKYSRGSFIFPGAQPTPHKSFSEEVSVLDRFFGNLASGSHAYVVHDAESPSRNWHIYYASQRPEFPMVTLEMCMTGLDSRRASLFYKEASEDSFSYASYEAMGFDPSSVEYGSLVEKVLKCFRPSDFSVAVTIFGGQQWASSWGKMVDAYGYSCRLQVEKELPCGGLLVYQSFSLRPTSPMSLLHFCKGEEMGKVSAQKLMSRL